MKCLRYCLLIALLPVVIAASPAAGLQQNSSDEPQTIVVDVDRVNILFTVKDKSGKLITNLKQDDFKLEEDGKPQSIIRLNIDQDLPLNIAMLIDQSGTVQSQMKLEQDAAIEFLNKTLKHGKDRAIVIAFDSDVYALPPNMFTDNVEDLSASIRKILAGGGTAMFDALYFATQRFLSKEPQRRLIVLISDGQDNNSRNATEPEVWQLVQKNEVVVYGISPNVTGATPGADSKDRDRGDKALRNIAAQTGGRAYFPKRLSDLELGFQSIGEEVRSQYSLIYSSSNKVRDCAFRRFQIIPKDKRYSVNTRPGYYPCSAAAK
jgi:VWFA-related protein